MFALVHIIIVLTAGHWGWFGLNSRVCCVCVYVRLCLFVFV